MRSTAVAAGAALLGFGLAPVGLGSVGFASAAAAAGEGGECRSKYCGRNPVKETMLLQRQYGKDVVDASFRRNSKKNLPPAAKEFRRRRREERERQAFEECGASVAQKYLYSSNRSFETACKEAARESRRCRGICGKLRAHLEDKRCNVFKCEKNVAAMPEDPPATCGSRISWLVSERGMSFEGACLQVAETEEPAQCGSCLVAQKVKNQPSFCESPYNEKLWDHLCGHWEKVLAADAVVNGSNLCCDSLPAPCRGRDNWSCSDDANCIKPSCGQEEWYLDAVEADAMEAGYIYKRSLGDMRKCIFTTSRSKCAVLDNSEIDVTEAGKAVLHAIAMMDSSGLQATAWEVVKEFANMRQQQDHNGGGNSDGDASPSDGSGGKFLRVVGSGGADSEEPVDAIAALAELHQRRSERSLLSARRQRSLSTAGTLDAGVNQKVTVL